VSITETEMLVSAVAYTHRPPGLIATPSGSMPTMRVAPVRCLLKVIATAVPAS
jgi:hypothetical protein